MWRLNLLLIVILISGCVPGLQNSRIKAPTGFEHEIVKVPPVGDPHALAAQAGAIELDADLNGAIDKPRGGTNAITAEGARVELGVEIGVDVQAYNSNIQTHISSTANPHSVTAAQVGLGSCDNTADLDKPISTATQTALDAKAKIAYTLEFDNTDLTSNVLTVTHAVTAYPDISIYDNNNEKALVTITYTSATTFTVDFGEAIAGTWHLSAL